MAFLSSQPWVEKYRPKSVSEVAYQEEVVKTLNNALDTGNLPHLLLYGPPGTGKTSTALAIARQLFGPELVKSRVLELNASDDRGINVVRTKIKDFAAIAVGHGVSGYPSPPFKIIILDEADSMTEDAQNALRRTMETHSRVTRFFFICNYVSRIIEPLASRCSKFRFKPLIQKVMAKKMESICKQEGLEVENEALLTLNKVSEGDLRRAITLLQSASKLYGNKISSPNIISVAGVVPDETVNEFLKICFSANFEKMQNFVNKLVLDAYPISQFLSQFHDCIVFSESITEVQKVQICSRMAEVDKNLIDGADEFLQLLDMGSNTIRALSNLSQIS